MLLPDHVSGIRPGKMPAAALNCRFVQRWPGLPGKAEKFSTLSFVTNSLIFIDKYSAP